jgi:hypothetical protein
MNMKSNVAQQINKNNQSNFLSGDVVVLKSLNLLSVNELITLKEFDGKHWTTDHRIGRVAESAIRTATTIELMMKRRLSPIELSLAEVS